MVTDVATGILISATLMFVIGIVLHLIARSTRPLQGPAQWANGMLLFGAGALLYYGRGTISPFLSIMVANTLIMFGTLSILRGANAFTGRTGSAVAQAVYATAYLLLQFVFFLMDSIDLRTIENAAFFGLCAVVSGYRLATFDASYTTGRYVVAGMLYVVALAFAVGGGMSAHALYTAGSLLAGGLPLTKNPATGFLVLFMPAINLGWGLGLIFMTMQRVVAELHDVNLRMADEIEERKRAEGKRAAAEARFRDFADAASDWYWEMDRDLRITYVSDALFRYSGAVPINKFLGKEPRELAGLDAEDEAWRRHETDLAARRPFRGFEFTFVDDDGEGHHWSISGQPVFDDAGEFQGYRGVGQDVTARKEVEEALRQSEQMFAAAFHQSPLLVSISTLEDGRFLAVNDTFHEATGFSREEMIGRTATDLGLVLPELREQYKETLIREGQVLGYEMPLRRRDGTVLIGRLSAERIFYGGGQALLALIEDVTDEKEALVALERSEARLADAIESIGDGFALWDRDDRLLTYNSRYLDFFRVAKNLIEPGRSFEEILRESAVRGIFKVEGDHEVWIRDRVKAHRRANADFEVQLSSGRWLHVRERPTSEGGIVGVYIDVTFVKKAEEDIHFRANFDGLTGLPNRASFVGHLDEAVVRSRRTRRLVAVMFVDLDRFKNVNDTLGHAIGDELLKQAGARIKASVRATDTVSRLGGDEFTVILNDLVGDMDATIVAETLIEQLCKPYDVEGHEVYAGASIGITICPNDGTDRATLLKNADMAMYQAKEMGGNTFRFFTRSMTERAQRFVEVEKDLRRALDGGEFVVHYQPVVDLAHGTLVGAEALVRWEHPQRGLVPPDQFVPVAEETGLVVGIGELVLRTAVRAATTWPAGTGAVGPYLAVNVSSRQFKGGFDREVVNRILTETGFPAHRLMFEITESLLMDQDERIGRALEDFRDMGVILAIDDFGTGYSSLSYLRRFPVSVLKIDREFIRDMDVDPNDTRLVQTIIAMAKGLKITLVAEGVEKPEQAGLLRDLGCDRAQGFLFGRPVAELDFDADFRDRRLAE
ncbi:MAG: EAL domain-containing protein [Hyphomicrobiales bacterium]|nr:EAL domain-containing protein [Hyphomicrobiales bacterium]MCP5370678.1 EAL domain-containing protein [Hyphomicrobiales bacterium]